MASTKKVTRITATDGAPKSTKKVEKQVQSTEQGSKNVFARIWAYFKGAWVELRQVRWPSRSATWGLTLAVIVFSIFFVLLILLLDTLFEYLFQLIIT